MSPLLKAIGIGIATFAASILLMYLISRIMNRPFLPRLPRAVTPTATPVRIFPQSL